MKYEDVERAKSDLLDKIGGPPSIGIIMGSGISAVDEIMSGVSRFHYATIPHFPMPKVAGHRAQVVFGKMGQTKVVVFEGRVHYYEGHSMPEVVFSTRVLCRMGVSAIILTNSCGAVNPSFNKGQMMLISDHINLLGENPLHGSNEERWGPRFVDLSTAYDEDLRAKFRKAAADCGLMLKEGVYAALLGPTYETPAEIRYLRAIGADAVGMSTVPEAIVARHMGVKVAGISMLGNMAAGVTPASTAPISHDDVLESAKDVMVDLAMLLQRFFEIYD